MERTKYLLKRILTMVGLYHPSLGIKIGQERKAEIIIEHKLPNMRVLVETGTYEGWMVDQMKDKFLKIYSIEMDPVLFERAKNKFNNNEQVVILKGDSAVEIRKVLLEISEPALFWLDAHAPGGITSENSPIVQELMAIFKHPVKKHTILIDDARHFDLGTIKNMEKMAKENSYIFTVKDGIFRLYGRG